MKGSMEGVGCGFFLVAAEIIQRQGLQATIFFPLPTGNVLLQAL